MSSAAEGTRRRKRALADAVAGVAGSLVSLWTFYPIEVWKTNLQAGSTVSKKSMFQGCRAKTLHTASSSFCYFFLYSWIFSNWKRRAPNAKTHPGTRLILSAVAAMLNTMITFPLDVISSKQVTQRGETAEDEEKMEQVWEKLQAEEPSPEESSAELFQECVAEPFEGEKKDENTLEERSSISSDKSSVEVAEATEESWSSLWKGLTPALLLCSNPSINYTVFDMAKNRILTQNHRASSSLSMPEAFFVGLFAKFVATIATYPLIRAKVIMMVTSEKSLLGSLIRSYNKEGARGLYKGCDWQLLHTVLKSALMMMVREKITASVHQLVVGNTTSKQ
jgi:hypothetical protein